MEISKERTFQQRKGSGRHTGMLVGGGGEVGDAGQRPGQAEWDVRSQKSSCAGTSRQGQVMWALVQAVVRI